MLKLQKPWEDRAVYYSPEFVITLHLYIRNFSINAKVYTIEMLCYEYNVQDSTLKKEGWLISLVFQLPLNLVKFYKIKVSKLRQVKKS